MVFFKTQINIEGNSNSKFTPFISSCEKMPMILKPEIYQKSQWIFTENKKEHCSSTKKNTYLPYLPYLIRHLVLVIMVKNLFQDFTWC